MFLNSINRRKFLIVVLRKNSTKETFFSNLFVGPVERHAAQLCRLLQRVGAIAVFSPHKHEAFHAALLELVLLLHRLPSELAVLAAARRQVQFLVCLLCVQEKQKTKACRNSRLRLISIQFKTL